MGYFIIYYYSHYGSEIHEFSDRYLIEKGATNNSAFFNTIAAILIGPQILFVVKYLFLNIFTFQ